MRKICVVTGTRAEYGLLKPLLASLSIDPGVVLQLVVTGSHLSHEYGYTIQEIFDDGFSVDDQVEILISSNSTSGVSKSFGIASIGLADSFARLKPDLLVLLGDRYEALAAAVTGVIAGIPLAHLHGGETTEGAIDDSFRHAITKLSSIHFCSTKMASARVIQMGENPERVFSVGAIGLDSLNSHKAMTKDELETNLGVEIRSPLFIVTLHPETCYDTERANDHARCLVEALAGFPEATMIFTGSNSDAGGVGINKIFELFVEERRSNSPTFFSHSLGQVRYLSALRHADLVIGNSSSGIIEAHPAGTICINIGDRQRGREQAHSVVNSIWDITEIRKSISIGLTAEHQNTLKAPGPYGVPGVSDKILLTLKSIDLSCLRTKPFHLLSGGEL